MTDFLSAADSLILQKNLDDYKFVIEDLNERNNSSRREITRLREQEIKDEKIIDDLQKELKDVENKYQKIIDSLKKRIDELENVKSQMV